MMRLVFFIGGLRSYRVGRGSTYENSDQSRSHRPGVIGHEWIHNYLTFRPLGLNYGTSGALRTMNETTAESIGIELGALLIQRYYPDLAPPRPTFANILKRDRPPAQAAQAPSFDFHPRVHYRALSTCACAGGDWRRPG